MATITKTSPFSYLAGKVGHEIAGMEFFTCNIGLYKHKNDLLIVHFKNAASIGGLFTKSKMASDPVLWCKKNIYGEGVICRLLKRLKHKINPTMPIIGKLAYNLLIKFLSIVNCFCKIVKPNTPQCRVLVVNSGCSNTYTGENGLKIINATVHAACKHFNCSQDEVFISSTGVIGQYFDANLIANAIDSNKNLLKPAKIASDYFEMTKAIETTDTFSKIYSQTAKIDGKEVKITGIIKGSGMVEPNMATMLGYIFCDANVSSGVLQKIMNDFKESTFNSITVDSDSSTSDTVLAFATCSTKGDKITNYNDKRLDDFKKAFGSVMLNLAKLVVMDGEGISKFITIKIQGASSYKQAKILAKSIANSPLVKTAIAGGDANWGRIAMALGKTLQNIDRNKVEITFGDTLVAKNWQKQNYNENDLTEYLRSNQFIDIGVNINNGNHRCTVYTCDLTHEYISINGDYRS